MKAVGMFILGWMLASTVVVLGVVAVKPSLLRTP